MGGAVQENVAKIWSKTNLFQILRVYNINERKKKCYITAYRGGGFQENIYPLADDIELQYLNQTTVNQ